MQLSPVEDRCTTNRTVGLVVAVAVFLAVHTVSATTYNRFISGLSTAADDDPRATYFPLTNNGTPTTASAGIGFPGNDWLALPDGDQSLANVGGTSQLLNERAALRQKHLAAVANLLDAIDDDRVERYLSRQFRCPN